MGFTGKEALKWKNDFYDAFELMQKKLIELLAERKSAEWLEARKLSKVELRQLTDLIRDKLIPLMIQEGAFQNAIRYVYKNYISIIQKLLGIEKGTRDELPSDLLYELGKVEKNGYARYQRLTCQRYFLQTNLSRHQTENHRLRATFAFQSAFSCVTLNQN